MHKAGFNVATCTFVGKLKLVICTLIHSAAQPGIFYLPHCIGFAAHYGRMPAMSGRHLHVH